MNITIQENSKYGLVVSSRVIAKELGKRHDNVVRDLEKILTTSNLRTLILPSNYKDRKGEERKEYLLTKDGFTLYMFNIQGYQDFKMAYIQKFNEMEKILKENTLPFKQEVVSTVMIPLDKINYWSRIRELSNSTEKIRSDVYKKLRILTEMAFTITTDLDNLSNIVFEVENCINKIENK